MARPSRSKIVRRWTVLLAAVAVVIFLAVDLAGGTNSKGNPKASTPSTTSVDAAGTQTGPGRPLAGRNVYAADTPFDLSPAVARDVPLVYVPNSVSNSVTEIDPATRQIVRTFPVGAEPQHVVPSWDLKTLWV